MIYCLCSDLDHHVIKTFDNFISALVFNMVYNDHFIDGSYIKQLNV